ncbi:MAG: LysM peptidoglycan-binding domain-containing protein [Bacteriovoracaceae bacterium]|nr:LysM peptidoglycan-binding domain-containing protein [Bacteriovoracaceae bacterium]
MKKEFAFLTFILLLSSKAYAQEAIDADSLELIEPQDINLLLEQDSIDQSPLKGDNLNLSDVEELDDLEAIKNDSFKLKYVDAPSEFAQKPELDFSGEKTEVKANIVNDKTAAKSKKNQKTDIFNVGESEKSLLEESKLVSGKIPQGEWNEIATASEVDKYEIQQNDWLWKISQKLFGSGFYYSKVWAMNPQITNPHEVEPGMVLTFDTGTSTDIPNVKFGEFSEEYSEKDLIEKRKKGKIDYRDFSDSEPPPWLAERKILKAKGTYFQYISEETYDDLEDIGKKSLITEYDKYEPPATRILIKEPGEQYDDTGFDKTSKISFDFSEGFFLNTFILSNIMIDLGKIDSSSSTSSMLQIRDRVFIKFDSPGRVKPGDLFSLYRPGGKVSHESSDREGFKYTVVGQVRALKKLGNLWECEIFELSDTIERGERVTTYMSKIKKIYKSFSKRIIEASVMAGYDKLRDSFAYGDVVYLDRGRIDGVEIGNIFEVYSITDPNSKKQISTDPSFKIGELTVISLSDNFATALISSSNSVINAGSIVVSKTIEHAMRDQKLKSGSMLGKIKELETGALDELDIELNLDNINEDLLDKADQIQLTDDELQELERQEREKSIIKEHEKDLKELERLESEITEAEAQLNEARVDEDKFLEQMNLDNLEKQISEPNPDAFGSLDEIEETSGRQYMDQDINNKENPYGLTEFDLEEIDELLNTETNKKSR